MRRAGTILAAILLAVSCSTTKLLPEGTYRLAQNKVVVHGEKSVPASDITPYLKQKANGTFIFGWNPLINVYNWSDGSGKGINGAFEKVGVAPVQFDPSLVDASTKNIINHLDYLGYYHSKVDAEVNTDKGRLAKVRYDVYPGKRYPIDRIVFDIPEGEFRDEFMRDTVNLSVKKGDFLSEKSLEQETTRSTAYMRNLGYYAFNKTNFFFEADTLGKSNILHYRVRGYSRNEPEAADVPIRKFTIGDVTISHSDEVPFREKVLRKFNTIRPGDVYSETLVNNAYNRFSALKVFSSVAIEMTPVDSSTVDCDIKLGGSGVMGFKINGEASINNAGLYGLSPQLSFFHKNIFHGGEWLNIGVTGNWQYKPRSDMRSTEFGVSASLSFPKLLGFDVAKIKGPNIPRTDVKLSYNYQNRPEYKRSIANFTYGYSGQFSDKLSYQLYPLQANLTKLYDVSADFLLVILQNPSLWDTFTDHIDLGVGGSIYHTTNADIVPKTSYRYSRFNFDLSGNVVSLFNRFLPTDEILEEKTIFGLPYNQYVKGELNLGQTFRFGRNNGHALAMRLDAGVGYAYGNSLSLPFEKRFYCGGASSMRGWQARMLGPGYDELMDYFIIPSQVGDIKLEADLEYRFKMFWKLEGALFAEAGNVWEWGMNPKDMLGSVAGDWGAGIRVNLDFILMRLDAGFKVHDPSRPEGQRWLSPAQWFRNDGFSIHFGVGYPF